MYNLAKLLTDEPAKLERLILLFLKLIISFAFTVMFMGYNFSVQAFIDKPIPDKFSAVQFTYFFIIMVVVWFTLWTLICDIILCELIVRLICWKFSKKGTFDAVLQAVGKISKNTHYAMVVDILEELEGGEGKEDIEEGHSRLNKYFSLAVIVFMLFLISPEINLNGWQIFLGILIIINLLVAVVVIHLVKSYAIENRESVIRQLEPMAYRQKALDAIKEMNFFTANYGEPTGKQSLSIKRKSDDENYPQEITIDTVFHWNQELGQTALAIILKEWMEKYKKGVVLNNCVLLTNIEPTAKIKKMMEPLHGFIYIHATTEKEIFHRLELAMFQFEIQQREKVLALAPKE